MMSTVSEKLLQVAENVPRVYHAGQMNVVENAECLKGSKSGSAILIDDVSPVTHDMGVKVRGKNLLPYPYYEKTKTQNGITFTDNGDGSITVNTPNGPALESTQFYLYLYTDGITRFPILENMVLSGCPSGGSYSTYTLTIDSLDSTGKRTYNSDLGNGVVLKGQIYSNLCYIQISKGATLNNVVFKPQLELGTTATAYTPYVDLTAVKVRKSGKNLLDVSKFPLTPVLQSDGSFILNKRTAIGEVDTKIELNLPAGVYFISVDIKAPIGKNYRPKIVYVDGSTICPDFLSTGEYVHMGFATNGKAIKEIFLTFSSGSVEVQFKNFQIELGSTATEYEPYIGAEYTPTADGVVNGVTSLYPNTTLMTDTEGVLIDCEYYKDIDKTYNKLSAEIALSGGE